MATWKTLRNCLCSAGIAASIVGCTGDNVAGRHSWWNTSVAQSSGQQELRHPVKTNVKVADLEAMYGHHAEARKHYREALKHDDKAVEAIVGIAKLDLIAGENSRAEKGFKQGLEYDPKSVDATLGLARVNQLEGKNVEAEQGYKKAINLNPSNAEAHDSLGQYYVTQKRWDEAAVSFMKAAKVKPRDSAYRQHLAIALANAGDFEAAMPHFTATVGRAAGYYNIAYILQEKGKLEAAERQYRRALAIDPSLNEARQMLAELSRQSGRGDSLVEKNQNRTISPYTLKSEVQPTSFQEPVDCDLPQRPTVRPQTSTSHGRYDSVQRPKRTTSSADRPVRDLPAFEQSRADTPTFDEAVITNPAVIKRTSSDDESRFVQPAVGVSPFGKPESASDVDMDSMTPEQREQWANQQ